MVSVEGRVGGGNEVRGIGFGPGGRGGIKPGGRVLVVVVEEDIEEVVDFETVVLEVGGKDNEIVEMDVGLVTIGAAVVTRGVEGEVLEMGEGCWEGVDGKDEGGEIGDGGTDIFVGCGGCGS